MIYYYFLNYILIIEVLCLIYLDYINIFYYCLLWCNLLNQIYFVVFCVGERLDKFVVNVNLYFEDLDYFGLLISLMGEVNGGDINGIGSFKLNFMSFSSFLGLEFLSFE